MPTRAARGFAPVVIVVINAIIGILIGLLLPAVQAAREAARRAEASTDVRIQAVGASLRDIADGTSNTLQAAVGALQTMAASGEADRAIIGIIVENLTARGQEVDALGRRIRRLRGGEGADEFAPADRSILREAARALTRMRRALRTARNRLTALVSRETRGRR